MFDGVKVSAVATSTDDRLDNYLPSAWLHRSDVDWPFPVLADSKTGTAAKAYGLPAFPYFVLVNADGTVAGRATGEVSDADVKADIKALKAGDPLPGQLLRARARPRADPTEIRRPRSEGRDQPQFSHTPTRVESVVLGAEAGECA